MQPHLRLRSLLMNIEGGWEGLEEKIEGMIFFL
jgi:hypothetical protein